MKKFVLKTLFFILLFFITGCNKEVNEPYISLNTYIVGKWHSKYIEVIYNGQTETREITKTGEWSVGYCELVFNERGKCFISHWQQKSGELSKWVEQQGKYEVSGELVYVTFGDEVDNLLWMPDSKVLCLHTTITKYGTPASVNLYFAKQ